MKIKKFKYYFSAYLLLSSISLSGCEKIENSVTDNFNTSISISEENNYLLKEKSIEDKSDNLTKIDTIDTKFSTTEIVNSETEILDKINNVTISFTGDCTLGTYATSQNRAFEVLFEKQKDYSYYFKNVKEIFENDDYTVVNLEGPLTDATIYQDKQFAFKGRMDYVNILLNGNVEAVNLSNNHIYDYCEEGYNDTINVLKNNNIEFFDNSNFLIKEINGFKFGFAGFKAFNTYSKAEIDKCIKYFNDNDVDIKIISLHGGIEYDYQFDSIKEELAHYSIDNGADLVIGHHPHILQGIEEYKNKYIIYSLGNFCYGGNRHPVDMNSMIAQVTFNFKNDEFENYDLKLIPVSISSVDYENNFQPTILDGDEKDKVLKLINDNSKNFIYNE